MNIKAHIEAGHYGKWENGRAMVPMVGGGCAQIYVTDHPSDYCIVGNGVGGCQSWTVNGAQFRHPNHPGFHGGLGNLALPPPRRVMAQAWAVLTWKNGVHSLHMTERDAIGAQHLHCPHGYVVHLTGEYEEPWPP